MPTIRTATGPISLAITKENHAIAALGGVALLVTARQSSRQREVRTTTNETAQAIIGIAMLMVAFAALVLKIIEVARSK